MSNGLYHQKNITQKLKIFILQGKVLSNISLWNVTDFVIAFQEALPGHIIAKMMSIGMVEVHVKRHALKTYGNGAF